jgi:hypothetical protein
MVEVEWYSLLRFQEIQISILCPQIDSRNGVFSEFISFLATKSREGTLNGPQSFSSVSGEWKASK